LGRFLKEGKAQGWEKVRLVDFDFGGARFIFFTVGKPPTRGTPFLLPSFYQGKKFSGSFLLKGGNFFSPFFKRVPKTRFL